MEADLGWIIDTIVDCNTFLLTTATTGTPRAYYGDCQQSQPTVNGFLLPFHLFCGVRGCQLMLSFSGKRDDDGVRSSTSQTP